MRTGRKNKKERDNGDRAPEDMIECEFWDDTNSQEEGGDPMRGLRSFQETGHWNGDSDNDYLSSDDEEEEEENSNSKCNLSSGEEDTRVFKRSRTS